MLRIKNKTIRDTFLFMMVVLIISCAHKSGHNKDRINRYREAIPSENVNCPQGHTKVLMRKKDGVYLVPITVNGLNLDFIFDTGASNISLSVAEATVMAKQGKITEDDVVGQARFSDANGDVSVGIIVLLHSVQIGDITLHNVEASIVDNIQAPLLLGQSALAKFGKVTIDYYKNTIEFN